MREAGALLIDGIQIASTYQCCHCGGHFETFPSRYLLKKEKPVNRGFCHNCMAVTCGHPGCDPCIPLEKRLEMMERV